MTNVRGKFNYFACVAVVIVALLLLAILPAKVAFATSDMTFCILSYYELGDNQNGESQNSNGDYQIGGQNGGYQYGNYQIVGNESGGPSGNQIVENESGSQNAENENNNLNQKTLRYKVYLLKPQISESGQISENTQGSQNTQEEFSRNYFVGDYDNLQDALGIANEFREFQQNQNETESITVKKRVVFGSTLDERTNEVLGECVFDKDEPIEFYYSDLLLSGKITSAKSDVLFKVSRAQQSNSVFIADGLSLSKGKIEIVQNDSIADVTLCGECKLTLSTNSPFTADGLSGSVTLEWQGEKEADKTIVAYIKGNTNVKAIEVDGYFVKQVASDNGAVGVLSLKKLSDGNTNNGLSDKAIAGIVVGSVLGGSAVLGATGFSISWFGVKKRTWSDLIDFFKRLRNSKEYKIGKKARKIKKKIEKKKRREEKRRQKEARKNGNGMNYFN
ncbi:MAG: hypothetical protein SPG87_00025 [Eubacteriales bacterium]|nr:hypothetical protein [Eubacteriales bacterium]